MMGQPGCTVEGFIKLVEQMTMTLATEKKFSLIIQQYHDLQRYYESIKGTQQEISLAKNYFDYIQRKYNRTLRKPVSRFRK